MKKYHDNLANEELWEGINMNIPDAPCSHAQTKDFEIKIEALIREASVDPNGGLKLGSKPQFTFAGDCQTLWLPVYTIFDFKVTNGEGGLCENPARRCFGGVFLQSGRGELGEAIEGVANDWTIVDRTDDGEDQQRLEERHEAIRREQRSAPH